MWSNSFINLAVGLSSCSRSATLNTKTPFRSCKFFFFLCKWKKKKKLHVYFYAYSQNLHSKTSFSTQKWKASYTIPFNQRLQRSVRHKSKGNFEYKTTNSQHIFHFIRTTYSVKEANSYFIIQSINDLSLQRLRNTTNCNVEMSFICLILLPIFEKSNILTPIRPRTKRHRTTAFT